MTNLTTERLWFLDNVRYWAVLAVVVLHVGMSQMFFPFGCRLKIRGKCIWPTGSPRFPIRS